MIRRNLSAIALGFLRPTRLNPLSVEESQLEAFLAGLTRETLLAIAKHQERRPQGHTPASPEIRTRRGPAPGRGLISIIRGKTDQSGAGGTSAGISSSSEAS